MAQRDQQAHMGHRARLRARYCECGLDAFADHEVLELLLTYAIPRRDVNELAHMLLNRYGTFADVAHAPIEDLMQVEGIGENAAVLLSLIAPLAKRYAAAHGREALKLKSFEAASFYIKTLFYGERYEVFYMICLDAKYGLIQPVELARGSLSEVQIYPRIVVERALNLNTHSVLLAHNHPSGDPAPSRADVNVTQIIVNALASVDIPVIDHIIAAGEKTFGFSQHGLFEPAQQDSDARAAELH